MSSKNSHFAKWLVCVLARAVLLFLLAGCGRHDNKHEHGHGHEHGGEASHGHGDDAQSFSGATHKEGEGITLLDQTRKLLGIEVQDVHEAQLPRQIRFTVRVFSESKSGTARTLKASGMVPASDAGNLRPGWPVRLARAAKNHTITGAVERVVQIPGSEAEAIVSFPGDSEKIGFGDFLSASVSVEPSNKTMAVPMQALVRSADGPFVYVVNGNAYLRTPVKTGVESEGLVEIQEGLLAGDSVVTRGAMDLWLIELRAVKGGQGCCPAPPAKSKT